MKRFIFIFLLFASIVCNAQLVFKNSDVQASIPKFIIKNSKTEIYNKVGGKVNLFCVFDQVPELYDNRDGKSRYRMTRTVSDKVAKRTFEITYTLYRQTQKFTANIRYTIEFHDKRPTKVLENYFES